MRYAAFISYNHRDRKDAAWLHRALETYRIPPHLRGRDSALGVLGARLPPIFQDREELAASADLASSVRDALADAASLIVICSPNSASSRWVNEEIRAFTALGRRDRIQCMIVGGEPNASHTPGLDPAHECLPPALFENGGGEPLAADIRPGQDSRAAARLKLLAGVLGIGYDELRQREQARRQRRLALIAAASTVGFALTSALAVFAFISRAEAVEQRDLARRKTITAERTVDFVKSMFEVADPSEARGRTITAREILDLGATRIDRELSGEPSVKAALGTTLGETYVGLGLLGDGQTLIQRMLRLSNVDMGTRTRQYVALGEALQAKADDQGSARAFTTALAMARDLRSSRSDLIARSLRGLGEAQTNLGDSPAAERNLLAALRMDEARGPAGLQDVVRDLDGLALNRFYDGRLREARADFERALAIQRERQGQLHPLSIHLLNQLGSVTYLQGDAAAAEGYFGRVIPLEEQVLGRTHPAVAASLNNYARLLLERRDYRSALPLLRRAVTIQLAERGQAGADLAFLYPNLGIAARGSGATEEGRRYLEQGLAIAVARKHRNIAPTLGELADLTCESGNFNRGMALLAQARPVMSTTYPDDPWRTAWLDAISARCLSLMGRDAEAARTRLQAAAIILAKWPANSHFGAALNR